MSAVSNGKGQLTAKLIEAIGLTIDHPEFAERLFRVLGRHLARQKGADLIEQIIAEPYESISRFIDASGIQNSASFRICQKAKRLAQMLISESGLDLKRIESATAALAKHLYCLGPGRQHDTMRHMHMLQILLTLVNEQKLQKRLMNIRKPVSHPRAELLIRETLNLPASVPLRDLHAQQAVLAAWLNYLRQNVGSCFATAPAAVIQGEQPEHFLRDLDDLLSIGSLKRTFGGVEYSVPLNTSSGAGDLFRPVLLTQHLEQLSRSPGLHLALEAASVIPSELELRQRHKQLKKLLDRFLKQLLQQPSAMPFTNADQILRFIILDHVDITEQDLLEHSLRPQYLPAAMGLVTEQPLGKKAKKQVIAVEKFYELYNIAQAVFKGLTDNALLKAWEFTLASFSGAKLNFYKWNLYASLGMQPEEPGGIGKCLHQMVQSKLDQANRLVQDMQERYDQAYSHASYVQQRLQRAVTEEEVKWMQVDYNRRVNDLNDIVEERNALHERAKKMANLAVFLFHQYDAFFPAYFQEVYDAEMHDVGVNPYDDSPAGFRLLYKHGRTTTSAWTMIYTPAEFVDALVQFFIATESSIAALPEMQGLEQVFSEIVTAIVQHVRTREFLETAFYRIANIHRTAIVANPLDNLEKIEKKPWAYVSGGTMTTLVSGYYSREQPPTLRERRVESEEDLLAFLLEAMKELPPRITQPYTTHPNKSMLMQSPTHAFVMKPGLPPFRDGWIDHGNTYTWIRSHILQPHRSFVLSLTLDAAMIQRILTEVRVKLPGAYQQPFHQKFSQAKIRSSSVMDLRHFILDTIAQEHWGRMLLHDSFLFEEIDSVLYTQLPLLPYSQLRISVYKILELILTTNTQQRQQLMRLYDSLSPTISEAQLLTPQQLQNICQGLFMLDRTKVTSDVDIAWLVRDAMRQLGLAMPAPVIFADTNWVQEYFGFLVNPGTNELGLWRVDYLGSEGAPMTRWKQWMHNTPSLPWSIYTRPFEYNL